MCAVRCLPLGPVPFALSPQYPIGPRNAHKNTANDPFNTPTHNAVATHPRIPNPRARPTNIAPISASATTSITPCPHNGTPHVFPIAHAAKFNAAAPTNTTSPTPIANKHVSNHIITTTDPRTPPCPRRYSARIA